MMVGGGCCVLFPQERGGCESEGRQTPLHPQPLDQKRRTQTRAEKALAPRRPEVAHRIRGPHQRGQTTTRPLQGIKSGDQGNFDDPRTAQHHQNDRYPLSPRIVALREILGMLRPGPEREPLPPRRHYEPPSKGRYRRP
jgi:hypothetical protein